MTTVTLVVARSPYCKKPGPEVEIDGAAAVTIRWKCSCGLFHVFEAKV